MANVTGRDWRQEWFDTGNPEIRRRSAHLRRLGLKVTVCNMGRQITEVGAIKMTLVDIRRNSVDECIWDSIICPTVNGSAPEGA